MDQVRSRSSLKGFRPPVDGLRQPPGNVSRMILQFDRDSHPVRNFQTRMEVDSIAAPLQDPTAKIVMKNHGMWRNPRGSTRACTIS